MINELTSIQFKQYVNTHNCKNNGDEIEDIVYF